MADLQTLDGLRWELRPGDECFPVRLRDMQEIPEVLYGMGDQTLLVTPCLGVIGARRATPYGRAIARKAGRVAAEAGVTLVSGGAMGCDAAAARGASPQNTAKSSATAKIFFFIRILPFRSLSVF